MTWTRRRRCHSSVRRAAAEGVRRPEGVSCCCTCGVGEPYPRRSSAWSSEGLGGECSVAQGSTQYVEFCDGRKAMAGATHARAST